MRTYIFVLIITSLRWQKSEYLPNIIDWDSNKIKGTSIKFRKYYGY